MLNIFKLLWNIWQLKTHRNDPACVAAAKALDKLGDKRAVEPLIKVLEEMNDDDVLLAAAEALGNLGDKRAVEPLIVALRNIGYTAAKAFGRVGPINRPGESRRREL